MEKDIILEVRAMTPKESKDFYKAVREFKRKFSKDSDGFGDAIMTWIFDNIYPGTADELTISEQVAIAQETQRLSEQPRYDRIKNLPKPSVGDLNE